MDMNNNIRKAREIINGRISPEKLYAVSQLVTADEFVGHFRCCGCPESAGLVNNCSLPCDSCWADALNSANSPYVKKRNKFEIIENGNTTVVLVKDDKGKVVGKGLAKRHVEDTPNRAVGIIVAVSRAIGVDFKSALALFDSKELAEELFKRL